MTEQERLEIECIISKFLESYDHYEEYGNYDYCASALTDEIEEFLNKKATE